MKRIACVLLALSVVLCGCGRSDVPTDTTASTTTTATTVVSATDTVATTPTNETESTATTTTETAGAVSTTTMTNENVPTSALSTRGTTTRTEAVSSQGTTSTTASTVPSKTTKPSRTGVVTSIRTTVTTTTADPKGIMLLGPADNVVVESQASAIENYLKITDEKQAAVFWTGTYYHLAKGPSFFAEWKSGGNLWKVYLSEDPQFTDVQPILTTDQWMLFSGLMPGHTYYWKVVNTYGMSSETRAVKVKDTRVRWVDADGGDNIRDLGGWKTESGRTVKYGLLYRGGCIDGYNGGPALSQVGCDTFKWLGIRSEIDLRGSDVKSNSSPFGAKYYKTTMTQYDYIFTDATTKQSLKTIFSILSFKGSYPVYFHCNAGADRTGTLAFLINGLLGVSYEDLTRDFELTGFSGRGKRLRSKLDETTATFDPSGIMQKSGGNHIAWGPLHDIMMTQYGTGSGKLSDAIENFLLTECHVTQTEIDTVRSILLE